MQLSIVVPCFNEVENVARLHDELLPVVERMVSQGWNNAGKEVRSAEIILVDDGSRDGTFAGLHAAFDGHTGAGVVFKFLKHAKNLGLGAAIRTGFDHATGDIVVTVDSDGTYEFSEIQPLLARLTPGVDIVTASPYHPMGRVIGVPAYRLILSRGSSALYRILVDPNVYTYTCLFRAYRSRVVRNIHFGSDGFLAGTEILVRAILEGYRVAELPAVLRQRMYGESKAKIAQTVISHLGFQGWVLLHRMKLMLGLRPKHV
jgi:dolichol-phosphate mannosyltransferase